MNAVAGRGKHVKDAEDSGGMRVITEYKGCRSSSNNGKGRCGSQAASGDLPSEIVDKAKSHPCYSEEAHHHYARMHVEVAPDCNIQCNYCNRKYDCANESHPAVVGEKLTPEQAARKLVAVATTIPQLTILGIAGPGEALADPKTTFKTFELAVRAAPGHQVVSTNERAGPASTRYAAAKSTTSPIDTIYPETGARIYKYTWSFPNHKRYTGIGAAKRISTR
ncbi:putative Zn-finger protein [Bradyrhizobium sp. LM3.2]